MKVVQKEFNVYILADYVVFLILHYGVTVSDLKTPYIQVYHLPRTFFSVVLYAKCFYIKDGLLLSLSSPTGYY